jgi:hypothetical protein
VTKKTEPWDRQKGESRQAFEAFGVYRDLGLHRSLVRTAQELGKNKALISRWSAKWRWVARVDAWDHEVQRREDEEMLREAERKAVEEYLRDVLETTT